MSTSFTKTYSVVVTFSRDDGEDLADSDLQSEGLRDEIKKEIAQVCTRNKGIFQSQPGTVSET